MPVDATHLISLFENATEGIVLTNGEGKIVLVNPAALRLFGYEADELTGKQIEVLIPEQVRPHHTDLRKNFYAQPSNRVMGHGRDLHARHKSGMDIPVEVSLSHYRRNNELFVIAFIVDITQRKKIEESIRQQKIELEQMAVSMKKLNADLEIKVGERTLILKEALQKLEESQKELSEALDKEKQLNEIKSRFLSMASHEFRTPLSTVLSSASLLGRYTKEEEQEKREKHIGKIKKSVNHLNDILDDFLSLGKLDEGKLAVSISEINIDELIEDTIEEMKGLVKKDQTINYSPCGNKKVQTDKKLLKNIIINLLSNAIKFSPEGTTVSLTCQSTLQETKVTVADQGIGIAPDDREHLFSSFYRGKNAFNIQGTGLGLHIVKRYLDMIGGEISVESQLDKGTCFTITLPSTNLI